MIKPTDEQLDELWDEIGCYYNLYPEVRNTILEALKRWGTPEPIALKDREPHRTDLDNYDSCWWWDEMKECYESLCGDIEGVHRIRKVNKLNDYPQYYTHWLPHWAIKQPEEDLK